MTNFKPDLGLSMAVVMAFTLAACSNIDSSRNTSDHNVPGRVLAVQVCSTCHGLTGESTSPMFPKLAGQQKEYLVAQLTDFKGHDRKDSRGAQYMWGYPHLTSKQMDELADYFSSQRPMQKGADGAMDSQRGEAIFRNGAPEQGVVQCAACHGAKGEGNGVFPRLAGQHASYLIEQIKVIQGSDHRPRSAPMKAATHELSSADALAVANYLESIGRDR